MTLLDVKAQIYTCTSCSLHASCKSPVPLHSPSPQPRYIVLGEAPGRFEDQAGEPFVGPAGMFLKRALRKAGLMVGDGTFMNAVCCYPKQARTPNSDEVKACSFNLFDQLEVSKSPYVLVCGKTALSAVLPTMELTYAAGVPIPAHGKMFYPVYHPAYVLRSRMVLESWERQLLDFYRIVNGLSTLNYSAHCVYCSAHRDNELTCHSHLKRLVKDQTRPIYKPPAPPHPSLFEDDLDLF